MTDTWSIITHGGKAEEVHTDDAGIAKIVLDAIMSYDLNDSRSFVVMRFTDHVMVHAQMGKTLISAIQIRDITSQNCEPA
jgi:hypothetical protein